MTPVRAVLLLMASAICAAAALVFPAVTHADTCQRAIAADGSSAIACPAIPGATVTPTPPVPPAAPVDPLFAWVPDSLRDYITVGVDAARDGLPADFTGTRNRRQYIRGHYWAPEASSQGTDPDVPSFAFQNYLSLYGSYIARLSAAAPPASPRGAPLPTQPRPR
jgi:hypothetical protein